MGKCELDYHTARLWGAMFNIKITTLFALGLFVSVQIIVEIVFTKQCML